MGVVEVMDRVEARGAGRVDTTMRELVEWTYAVQQAHRGGDGRACGYAGISQTGIVGEIGALGCMIDRSPSGAQYYGVSHVDDDALIVHEHVECLHWEYRQALITHGAVRSAPEWRPLRIPLRVVPVKGRRGAGDRNAVHNDTGDISGYYKMIFANFYIDGKQVATPCGAEITYHGDIETRSEYRAMRAAWPDAPTLRVYQDVVDHAREQYCMWYDAMAALQDALSFGRLRRWRVRGIGAAYEPWVNS
jgi:hypothetical protein